MKDITRQTIDAMIYKRAAIYARVSTDRQEEDGTSLVTQVQKCSEYCRQKGYIVAEVHIYRDVWTGAEYRERPELTKLRAAARNQEFDVAVFYAFDRLSRNQVHQAVIIDDLKYNSVNIECVTENFDDSPLGQFMRSAHGLAAELEREKIRERSHRGMMERFENGQFQGGGRPSYGYKWNKKHTAWLIDNEIIVDKYGNEWTQAKIVERIFSLVDAGMTHRNIIELFKEEGISPKNGGKKWALSTLNNILNNTYYTGQGFINKWRGIKRPGMGPRLVEKAPEEHFQVTVPAIISKELFDRVQESVKRNKEIASKNNRHSKNALLRCGLVKCGSCQGVMHVQQTPAGPCYACKNYTTKHKRPGIKIEILDEAAWKYVTECLKDEVLIEEKVEELKAKLQDDTYQELEPIEREINKVQQEQENLTLAISQIDMSKPENIHAIKSLTGLLEVSSSKIQVLENERKSIVDQSKSIMERGKIIEKFKEDCFNIAKGLDSVCDYEGKRRILEFHRILCDCLGI